MEDDGTPSEIERRLAEAERVLDELPREEVAQLIRDRGLLELALDALKECAESDDPTVRADAREALERYGLELLKPDDDPSELDKQ